MIFVLFLVYSAAGQVWIIAWLKAREIFGTDILRDICRDTAMPCPAPNATIFNIYNSYPLHMNFPDLTHPTLGLLRYNPEYNHYKGQITFQQRQVLIYIETDDRDNITSLLDRADRCFCQLDIYAENAKDYAVWGLLEIKNQSWLDEDEEPLTAEQFKTCMTLESLVISSDGGVQFYYNDGDLFWGHCILIIIDSSDRFVKAEISG